MAQGQSPSIPVTCHMFGNSSRDLAANAPAVVGGQKLQSSKILMVAEVTHTLLTQCGSEHREGEGWDLTSPHGDAPRVALIFLGTLQGRELSFSTPILILI